jgi:hypothetical protein
VALRRRHQARSSLDARSAPPPDHHQNRPKNFFFFSSSIGLSPSFIS